MECRFLAPSSQPDKNFAFAFVARSICDVFTMAAWSVGLQTAHQVLLCPFVFLHNLTLSCTFRNQCWHGCGLVQQQWPAGCRYTHPHIFLVKVGLLELLHVVGGLLRAQINHGKVFPAWSTNRISQCWIWSGPTSSQSYVSSLGLSKQLGNMLWTQRWAACGCTNEAWWSERISIVKPRRSCVADGARLWCRTYGHWLQGHALTGSAFECCSLGIGLKNACKNLIPKMCFLAANHMPPG